MNVEAKEKEVLFFFSIFFQFSLLIKKSSVQKGQKKDT